MASPRESYPNISENYSRLSTYIQLPEARIVEDDRVFQLLSPSTQDFLAPIKNDFCVYLNCLKQIKRWANHTYQEVATYIKDDDYQHVLGMLEINHDLKQLELSTFDYDDVDLMIAWHDGGEIITGDMSVNHPPEMDEYVKKMKEIESTAFLAYVLGSLRGQEKISTRSGIKNQYLRYENRNSNPLDKEAHLVKFIDTLQGDEFGLKNVYSKAFLSKFYKNGDFPQDPEELIANMIKKEAVLLSKVLLATSDPQDRKKLVNYLLSKQASLYGNCDYGYQDLYQNLNQTETLSQFL